MAMHVPTQLLISPTQLLISLCVFFHNSSGSFNFCHKACLVQSYFLTKAFLLCHSFFLNLLLFTFVFLAFLLENSYGLHNLLQGWGLATFKSLCSLSGTFHHVGLLSRKCGWGQILLDPTMGAKCSHRLTSVRLGGEVRFDSSSRDAPRCLCFVTKRALPVDHTPSIQTINLFQSTVLRKKKTYLYSGY